MAATDPDVARYAAMECRLASMLKRPSVAAAAVVL